MIYVEMQVLNSVVQKRKEGENMDVNELLSEEEVLEIIKEEFDMDLECEFPSTVPNANNGLVGC